VLTCSTCGHDNQAGVHFCNWCGTTLNGSATGLLPSRSLLRAGRYLILEKIGKGGMGAVYKASDLQLNSRVVAIKEMSQNGLAAQDLQNAVAAFTREAEILAHLSHPSLPHIYEQFEDNGRRYLVMEFIAGETLEELLERYHRQGAHLPLSPVIDIGSKLCTVLSYLHSQQPPVIFRDLKPSNVMLNAPGQVYLIDFGIARLFKPGQVKDTIALGSSGYAPPEQYRKATSPRSDIYSLGATLHQMLTGIDPSQHPFLFKPFAINNPRLEQLILSMVSLEEDRRPASMLAIQSVLDELALNQQPATQQAGQARRAKIQKQKKGNSQANGASVGSVPQAHVSPLVAVVVSSHHEDRYLWQRLYQQLIPLIDGFPDIEIRLETSLQAIDDADLTLLLLSDHILTSAECMAAADRAIDRHQTQGSEVLSVILSPCSLAGTRLEQTRVTPEHAIAHLSSYAQEQRIVEVAKAVRSLLVQVILAGKSSGPMNLLQWLLWQLYGNGLSSCRYFLVGHYAIKHIRPSGLAGILLHLFDLRKGRAVAEYLIGPLRCKDLLELLHSIASTTTDPERVQGIATRRKPSA
jgi:serine/threonine protein kinase